MSETRTVVDNIPGPHHQLGCRTHLDLEGLYREHYATLLRWVAIKTGDSATAEDIVQNTFLYVYFLSEKTDLRFPKAVLFKTAGWLFLNEMRRRRRKTHRQIDIEETENSGDIWNPVDEPGSPESILCMKQEVKKAMDIIEALPERCQTAFRLSRFSGFTYAQIASSMDISKSSVEKHMIHALKELRSAHSELNQF
ncbi:MAG: RNA polymerase sigma factor [Parvularculaceae bacterium]